jgi:lipoate-protein ligase B
MIIGPSAPNGPPVPIEIADESGLSIATFKSINLSPDREDVHAFVRDVEEVLIRMLADYKIDAFRLEGFTGVHTSRGKIAAIGVHISRWVTTHGFALNVNTDLSYFNLIIACEGEQVTSMQDLLGHEVDVREVEDSIARHFADVFDMKIQSADCADYTDRALAK